MAAAESYYSIALYMLSGLQIEKHDLFYDSFGGDVITILFVGVLMNGTDFSISFLCNAPSS